MSRVASFSYSVGQDRKTHRGNPLSGQYKETLWDFSITNAINCDVAHELALAEEVLNENETFLLDFLAKGGEISYYVTAEHSDSIAWILPCKFFESLARFQVKLQVEILSAQRELS